MNNRAEPNPVNQPESMPHFGGLPEGAELQAGRQAESLSPQQEYAESKKLLQMGETSEFTLVQAALAHGKDGDPVGDFIHSKQTQEEMDKLYAKPIGLAV